ncbi:MRPL2 [Malassezia furfur]|nr:MRPL2 [Malassezia furfur]
MFGAVRTASLRVATPLQTALLPSPALARTWDTLPAFPFGGAIQTRNSAKRGGAMFVYPGEIIVRQRGTAWHAGENVKMGRDHTLYATEPGVVWFYKQPTTPPVPKVQTPALGDLPLRLPQRTLVTQRTPEIVRPHPSSRHKQRRYVGVALDRAESLPAPVGAPRRRRFEKTDLNAFEREKELQRQGIDPVVLDPSLS